MWTTTTFVVAYVASIFTWPYLRSWGKALYEHPEETIKADITYLQDKLKGLKG